MKKQTSVDWLAEQTEIAIKKFLSKIKNPTNEDGRSAGELGLIMKDTIQTARQMHREEIEVCATENYSHGFYDGEEGGHSRQEISEQYYTQTFETP